MSNIHIVWEQDPITIYSNGELTIADYDYYEKLNAEETRKLYEALRQHYRNSKCKPKEIAHE